jgi:hypothetical protein
MMEKEDQPTTTTQQMRTLYPRRYQKNAVDINETKKEIKQEMQCNAREQQKPTYNAPQQETSPHTPPNDHLILLHHPPPILIKPIDPIQPHPHSPGSSTNPMRRPRRRRQPDLFTIALNLRGIEFKKIDMPIIYCTTSEHHAMRMEGRRSYGGIPGPRVETEITHVGLEGT